MKIPRPKLDVLEVILGKLEIPDLVHAGFVCCSWRNAYTACVTLGGTNSPRRRAYSTPPNLLVTMLPVSTVSWRKGCTS
jgi:hypothetical protein